MARKGGRPQSGDDLFTHVEPRPNPTPTAAEPVEAGKRSGKVAGLERDIARLRAENTRLRAAITAQRKAQAVADVVPPEPSGPRPPPRAHS